MSNTIKERYDVAIVGGGPAGSTVGSMLRTYNTDLSVVILDKAIFPRDHVGESQLPGVANICAEMGCWDKVEAANFPVKVGVVYRWGCDKEPWNFDFVDPDLLEDTPRPQQFEGIRTRTAFQVDRAVYDQILLDHAAHLGCDVHQNTRVAKVHHQDDHITSLEIESGQHITATHYVDASGAPALIRRALGVESHAPNELRNIALWDYWQGAQWGFSLPAGATRIYVLSLSYGWVWFIPVSKTRTSIGLIVPAEYYKTCGKTYEELYEQAIRDEPTVSKLLTNATREGTVHATNDWSHLSDRMSGKNWFLAGECCGFADPILAAGLLLAQGSARDCAFTINEIEHNGDAQWLRTRYSDRIRKNIWQYIRFAKFWYAANGQFTDLQEHCANIAREGGLRLDPKHAWRWLSQGGFALEEVLNPAAGSFDPLTSKELLGSFLGVEKRPSIEKYNVFKLNTYGAQNDKVGFAHGGRIHQVPCFRKGDRILPLGGTYGNMHNILEQTDDLDKIMQMIRNLNPSATQYEVDAAVHFHLAALDTMIDEGWVLTKFDRKRPRYRDPNW